MNKEYFISVLIPVKNEGAYLSQCIESFLNQNYSNFELIISDNCSSDDTWRIAKEFEARDNRIKLFRNEKETDVLTNLFKCYGAANGNLICFIGGDDFIENHFFVKAMHHFTANENVFAVVPRLSYFDDYSGNVLGIHPPAYFNDYLNNNMVNFTMFYRRHVHNDEVMQSIFKREYFDAIQRLKRVPLEPIGWWAILLMFLKAKKDGKICVFLDEPLIYKRCNCVYNIKGRGRKDVPQKSLSKRTLMSVQNSFIVWKFIRKNDMYNAAKILLFLLYYALRSAVYMKKHRKEYNL